MDEGAGKLASGPDGALSGVGRARLLAQTALLAGLSADAASALAPALGHLSVRRGQAIFAEGDQGDTLYIILTGKVKIGRTAADGRENMLAVLGPADIFGELSLFDPGPRTAAVIALTDVELASLRHDAMRTWMATQPEVAERLLRVLARRLRQTNDALADLVFTDVPGRVAKALLTLSQRFGEDRPDGLQVNHDLTQEELAQLVGASRETVNKALADFANRGWLQLDSRAVLILDRERLAQRAR